MPYFSHAAFSTCVASDTYAFACCRDTPVSRIRLEEAQSVLDAFRAQYVAILEQRRRAIVGGVEDGARGPLGDLRGDLIVYVDAKGRSMHIPRPLVVLEFEQDLANLRQDCLSVIESLYKAKTENWK